MRRGGPPVDARGGRKAAGGRLRADSCTRNRASPRLEEERKKIGAPLPSFPPFLLGQPAVGAICGGSSRWREQGGAVEAMGKRAHGSADVEAGARAQRHHPHHLQAAPLGPPEAAWVSWLVPSFVLANFVAFAYTMYVNDCPGSSPADRGGERCILQDTLGRFAFEPLVVNPLFGPTTQTSVFSFFAFSPLTLPSFFSRGRTRLR